MVRRHRLGRVDRDHPPRPGPGRHVHRHGRHLRRRPQRGAGRPRHRRPPRRGAAGHEVRHRPVRRRRPPRHPRRARLREAVLRVVADQARRGPSSTCTTCTARRRRPRSRRPSARWPSSWPRARSATWACPRSPTTCCAARTRCTRSPRCRASTRCGPATRRKTPSTPCASSAWASCPTRRWAAVS